MNLSQPCKGSRPTEPFRSNAPVPVFIAKLAVDYQQVPGKHNAQAINAGPDTDHRTIYVHALIDAKPWIDQLIQAAGQTMN